MTIFVDKRTVCVWLTCTVAAIHLLNIPAVWLRYSEDLSDAERLFVLLFQVSSEGKIPTWYSACTLLACSVLLVLIAVGSRLKQRPHTWHWAGLAAIFALLSLDEATGIHELSTGPLRELLRPSAPMYYAWVIPAFLCLVPFGLVYSKFVFLQEEGTRNLFVIAGAVYLAGALGVEMIGGSYRSGYGLDLTYGIIATVEEMFEMTGIVIFSYALMDHIERDSLELRLLFHMERCSNEEPVHVPTIESGRERASSAEVTDRLGTES